MDPRQSNRLDVLARAAMDALDAHVAILDKQGCIVAVNQAWIRFGRENAAPVAEAFVGVNYVAVCEEAARSGDESARAMLRSLRSLLAGSDERFAIDYACHSPGTRRWFQAKLTAFVVEGERYVSVVHENITARMLAQEERILAHERLQASLERERERARTDHLTGLSTREHFFDVAGKLASSARRYDTPLSVVMIDIDDFKALNDARGHQFGDMILQCVSRILREQMRAADVVARYGGDELIAALPHTPLAAAGEAAEKVRDSVKLCVRGGEAGVTVSVGVAEMSNMGETFEDAIRRADEALYAAKREGRNRVWLAPTAR